MTRTLYILHNDDSYEVEVDTNQIQIIAVWRFAGNKPVKPEFIPLSKLADDDILQSKIDDKLIRLYGDPDGHSTLS
jgi:hypothetical protein